MPLAALVVAAGSCGPVKTLRRQLVTPTEAVRSIPNAPWLKVHMRSGDVYVLSPWHLDTAAHVVSGTGRRFDRDRRPDSVSTRSIPLDSVVLFETNELRKHGSVTALTVMSVVTVGIGLACATNPKACFGSCPTFYADDSVRALPDAEGFSASVAPALEASDVDALYLARPKAREFSLRMTNEALETHVVRSVQLLAAEKPAGGHVYATQQGEFWASSASALPTHCSAPEGDCLATMGAPGGAERFSLADSTDLAVREAVDLAFPQVGGDTLGVVIASRQTLLSTFLLYQTLAYMGRTVGSWLSALETNPRVRDRAHGLSDALGGIDVQVRDAHGEWRTVGSTQETGPLAVDVRVIPLPAGARARDVRLRMAKGHWRVDYVALARLDRRVQPIVLDPLRVTRSNADDTTALAQLRDPGRALVTMPGDEYRIHFLLPQRFEDYEIFLRSRGYYLEWMRNEWLAEEDPARAASILANPARAMRDLAPAFKKHEATMEQAFWSSRYAPR